jgi:biopolymer transport protein ExbB
MISQLLLGMSLIGAQWVLYLLILLSIVSVALIFERALFYRAATKGLEDFRRHVRSAVAEGKWDEAIRVAQGRADKSTQGTPDLEAEMALLLLNQRANHATSPEVLTEVAQDPVVRARLSWERNLAFLATIGSNAPFIGLFGTVLGIIKAFHDLSQQAGGSAQAVTSGISEALVATAIGILVAIPAVVAFNIFQRRVKAGLSQAEAMKSYLIGRLAHSGGK